MNEILRRNFLLAAVLLLAWVGWYGWQDWQTSRHLNRLAEVVRSKELDQLLRDPPEEVTSNVDLAVRGIALSQGKDGHKTFELKADWATLDEKTSDITVRDPDILYTLNASEHDGKERIVHATSRIGRVENNHNRISMSGNVEARSEDDTLFSEHAVYVNEQRTLDFPLGAELFGNGIEGSAGHLMWNLNDNTIAGEKNVKVRWFPPMSEHTPEMTPDNGEQPSRDEGSLSPMGVLQ